MKKILFVGVNKNKDFYKIEFNVNWIEYLILKNIFKKKKYNSFKFKIIGSKYDLCITDEVVTI
jgi:hypothetical protein